MKITLDPGHGYAQNLGLRGYYESKGNLAACLLLKKELEAYGFEVVLTRNTDNANPSLDYRGKLAISTASDVFISWHSDANANASIRGVTVFNSVKRPESKALAESLASTIAATMGIPMSPYSAAKNGVYTKIRDVAMPNLDFYGVLMAATGSGSRVKHAMLIEHGFHTNSRDVAALDNTAKRTALAKAEARCIAEYLGVSTEAPPTPSSPPAGSVTTGKLYYVQVGAFGVRKNADAYAATLKKSGYKAIVKPEGALFKVQVGAFGVKANAETYAAALKNKGYAAMIV